MWLIFDHVTLAKGLSLELFMMALMALKNVVV